MNKDNKAMVIGWCIGMAISLLCFVLANGNIAVFTALMVTFVLVGVALLIVG